MVLVLLARCGRNLIVIGTRISPWIIPGAWSTLENKSNQMQSLAVLVRRGISDCCTSDIVDEKRLLLQ